MLSVMHHLGKSLNIAKKYIMKYCSNSYAISYAMVNNSYAMEKELCINVLATRSFETSCFDIEKTKLYITVPYLQ